MSRYARLLDEYLHTHIVGHERVSAVARSRWAGDTMDVVRVAEREQVKALPRRRYLAAACCRRVARVIGCPLYLAPPAQQGIFTDFAIYPA